MQLAATALKEEREKLVRQLTELGANEKGELTGDMEYGDGFADAAASTAERTELLGIVDNLTDLLEDVDRALERIAHGSYGQCEDCGREISVVRLEHRPTSRFCVECKQKRH